MAKVFRLKQYLNQAVSTGITPGISLLAARSGQKPIRLSAGRTNHQPSSAPCDQDTIFDLASLTKPLTTTLWCLQLADQQKLDLDAPLNSFLPIADTQLGACPLWRLLTHTSGLPAHRRFYEGLGHSSLRQGDFERAKENIRRMIRNSRPVTEPGMSEIYSDLGYLLLENICEIVDRPLKKVWRDLPCHGPESLHFINLPSDRIEKKYAATERCPWRRKLLQAEVHDDNCWTMGGVAGHAGLFGTIDAVYQIAQKWLLALNGHAGQLSVSSDILQRCVSQRNVHPGGTRVFGWDTPTPGRSSAGRHFGRRSIGHLGFTGTSLWIDPDQDLIIVLLTNRVCPSRDDIRIRSLRPDIHNLAWQCLTEQFRETQ